MTVIVLDISLEEAISHLDSVAKQVNFLGNGGGSTPWVYILGVFGRGGGMVEKSPWCGRKIEFYTFSKNFPKFLHKNAIKG